MRSSLAGSRNKESSPVFHITADEAFPAIEQLILDASTTLDISLHVFSPRTKTRNAQSHARRLQDWGDLLVDCVKRSVHLRLLINDFDPIGGPELHTSTWERIAFLKSKFADVGDVPGSYEIVVGVPGGQSGSLLRTAVWPFIRGEAKTYFDELRQHKRDIPPRLADIVSNGDHVRRWPPARNYTQVFHQKFFVADGRHVILGGLDIDERRFDDTDHEKPAPETWHDVNVEFESSAAIDLTEHFEKSFSAAKQNGQVVIKSSCAERFGATNGVTTPDISGRIVTTAGRARSSLFSFGPATDVTDIEIAIVDMILSAKRFIYAETQYFRSSIVRDTFIKAAKINPRLHAIVLLPAAPDVVAFDGQVSPVHRYAEWLQMRALYRVGKAFDGRFGAFSMTNHLDRDEQVERDALHGKSVVYVHSKLIMRDDAQVLVSSANLNGRSMKWDFETGYLSHSADAAKSLRERLWLSHLGPRARDLTPYEQPAEALESWHASAADWQKGEPKDRLCGVVPFPIKKTRRFAKRHFFIPENMV